MIEAIDRARRRKLISQAAERLWRRQGVQPGGPVPLGRWPTGRSGAEGRAASSRLPRARTGASGRLGAPVGSAAAPGNLS
jgi:hypothetical protein